MDVCLDLYESQLPADLIERWQVWLNDNFDLGNYDVWKDRSTIPPTRRVSSFVPPHLEAEFRAALERSIVPIESIA